MPKLNSRKQNTPEARTGINWIVWGSALSTLVLWTTVNDPFNAPKSWVLSITAFWLLGWVLFQVKDQCKVETLKWASLLSGFFILTLTLALIATNNKYIGFFGEYQRRTGYLAYISFTIFFLTSVNNSTDDEFLYELHTQVNHEEQNLDPTTTLQPHYHTRWTEIYIN